MGFDPASRFRDQIESSARAYQNPLRQDPWAKNVYLAAESKNFDRMETSRERANRELIEKFQKNHFKLASGSITMLVHLGKGLVLILVMPPYFLLFVAPKWAYQVFSPAAEATGEMISQFFFRVSAWTVDLYGAFANQFFNFRNRFKRKKKAEREIVKQPLDPRLVSMKVKIVQTLTKLLNLRVVLRSVRERALEWVIRYAGTLKQSFIQKCKAIVRKAQEKVGFFVEKLKIRFEKWIAPKKEKVIKFAKAIDRAFEKAYLFVKKPVLKAAEKLAFVFEPVVYVVKTVTRFIPAVISPPFVWMAQKTSLIFKGVERGFQRAKPVLQRAIEKMGSIISNAAAASAKPIAQAGLWMAHAIQRATQVVFVQVQKTSSLILFSLKRAAYSVLDEGKRQFKRFVEWSRKKGKQAIQAMISLGYYLKKIPGFLWAALKKLAAVLSQFIARSFRAMRVLFILIRYLVAQSLIQLEKSLHKTQ